MSMEKEEESSSNDYGLDPFQLIERGNAFESSSNYWSAAGCFGRASLLLKSQGDVIFTSMTTSSSSNTNTSSCSENVKIKQVLEQGRSFMEQEKIGQLYHSQSFEYLYKARDCFVKAITLETKDDQTRQSHILQQSSNVRTSEYVGNLKMQLPQEIFQPLLQLISPNEALRRTRIFQQIYSTLPPQQQEEVKKKNVPQQDQQTQTIQLQEEDTLLDLPTVTQTQDETNVDTNQLSLEERLARLDSSLPPRKSQSQQVKDRLNQLGVYIPDSSSSQPEMDEQDEIDFIVSQAKDEVALYHNNQDDNDDEVKSILRKSGIRIDVNQYQTIEENDADHHPQETVQDLLHQAEQMKKKSTELETNKSTETNAQEEEEEKVVNQLIEAATNQINKEQENVDSTVNENDDTKETTTTISDEEEKVVKKIVQDATNENDKKKVNDDDDDLKDLPKLTMDDSSTVENTSTVDLNQSVANLLNRAKNLTVETNNDTKKQQESSKPEEKTKETSQLEKMKETIKLLTAAQKLIDDATIFLDEDILHVDLQDEIMSDNDDDDSETKEKNIISNDNHNNEMREKGKASIRAAQECLQKLLDSWP